MVKAGIFVAMPPPNGQSSVRSNIIGRADGRCRARWRQASLPDVEGAHPCRPERGGRILPRCQRFRSVRLAGGFFRRAGSPGSTAGRLPATTPGQRQFWIGRTRAECGRPRPRFVASGILPDVEGAHPCRPEKDGRVLPRRQMFVDVRLAGGFFRRAGSPGSTAGRLPATTPQPNSGLVPGAPAKNWRRDATLTRRRDACAANRD